MADDSPAQLRAAAAGISPHTEIRAELIRLRDASMDQWPEAIEVTVILTHAIWWLGEISRLEQAAGDSG